MAYCLDDILTIFRKGLAILSTFWTGFYFFNSLLLFTGFSLMAISFKERKDEGLDDNRAALSGNHIVNVGTALFCMGVTLQLLRPLRWFLFFGQIGPVMLSIVKCYKDFFRITVVYLVILNAFAIGSFSLFKTFDLTRNSNITSRYTMRQQDLVELKGLLGGFFWRLFDPGAPEYASITRCDPSLTDESDPSHCAYTGDDVEITDLSQEFSHLMGLLMWAGYQIVCVILLINILIAMMTSTYQQIINDDYGEWKYSKSFYMLEFIHPSSIMPPPFK